MSTIAEKRARTRYEASMKGKETKKAWRKRNRTKIRHWKLRWSTSPSGKESARRYWRKSPRGMWTLYKKVAAKKGLSFAISYDNFAKLIFKPCSYCGVVPIAPNRNGLDRVDNTKGYYNRNVVPCCHPCNQMKGKLTVQEFLNRCKLVVRKSGARRCR